MTKKFDYLVVGGGMTADAAARGVRELDGEGSIGIVSEDSDPPYARPALSKKLWTDPGFDPDDNWLHTSDATGAVVLTGARVTGLDPEAHEVVTADGVRLRYGRLLLATGGVPKTLDLPASERCIYFRGFEDYHALRRLSGGGRHIAVAGGSYIGTELAAALTQHDTRVTLIHPDETLGGSMFPPELARHFESAYEQRGVQLMADTRVLSAGSDGGSVTLQLSDGSEQRFDGVVTGLGIEPRTALAEAAGLRVDDGIVVDERLRTDEEDIHAAGDVARYPDRILGPQRVEHVDNARRMGAAAGRIMAGSTEAYNHTPFYDSSVFDMQWQAIGTLDSSLETVLDWSDSLGSGVVYYLDDGTVAGVLLWNVDKMDAAREVLADEAPQDVTTLMGRIELLRNRGHVSGRASRSKTAHEALV